MGIITAHTSWFSAQMECRLLCQSNNVVCPSSSKRSSLSRRMECGIPTIVFYLPNEARSKATIIIAAKLTCTANPPMNKAMNILIQLGESATDDIIKKASTFGCCFRNPSVQSLSLNLQARTNEQPAFSKTQSHPCCTASCHSPESDMKYVQSLSGSTPTNNKRHGRTDFRRLTLYSILHLVATSSNSNQDRSFLSTMSVTVCVQLPRRIGWCGLVHD